VICDESRNARKPMEIYVTISNISEVPFFSFLITYCIEGTKVIKENVYQLGGFLLATPYCFIQWNTTTWRVV
jgi:hypothetical protein